MALTALDSPGLAGESYGTGTGVLVTGPLEPGGTVERGQNRDQWLRAIFDQAFELIGLMDLEGRLLMVNRTALDSVGAEESEVVGKYLWETLLWGRSIAPRDELRRAVRRAAQGEFVRFEASFLTPGGQERHFDFSLKPVRDERGEVALLIPEGRDITERKEMERRLSDLVNRAYGLTPEEIELLWNTAPPRMPRFT